MTEAFQQEKTEDGKSSSSDIAETLSWVCILGAAPFAMLGFITYHGMTAEQFIWAWIKSEILMPKKLVFRSENLYFDAVEPVIKKYEKESMKKEGRKKNDKNAE